MVFNATGSYVTADDAASCDLSVLHMIGNAPESFTLDEAPWMSMVDGEVDVSLDFANQLLSPLKSAADASLISSSAAALLPMMLSMGLAGSRRGG